jgi:hypothetical protein
MGGIRFHCLHCLTPDSARLRVDKKGRPFSTCGMCGTRAFIPTSQGLRGLRLIAPGLVEIYQRMLTQWSSEDKQADDMIRQLQVEQKNAATG